MTNIHLSAFVHPTSILGKNVTIGEGSYIGPYCIIGYPAEHKNYWGKDGKGVVIGKDCKITGFVTIDEGTEEATTLHDGVWCLKRSHIGHDAYIGENTIISVGSVVGGHCLIEADCNLGIGAYIHQRVRIARGVMIGMGSIVTKGLITEPYSKYVGNPARYLSPNVKP